MRQWMTEALRTCRETSGKAPAEAASALCSALPELLQPERPAVLRQSALAALGAAAAACGRQRPTPLLGALPSVLAATKVQCALCLLHHSLICRRFVGYLEAIRGS